MSNMNNNNNIKVEEKSDRSRSGSRDRDRGRGRGKAQRIQRLTEAVNIVLKHILIATPTPTTATTPTPTTTPTTTTITTAITTTGNTVADQGQEEQKEEVVGVVGVEAVGGVGEQWPSLLGLGSSFADEITNLIKLVVENDIDKRFRDKNNLAAAIIYIIARKLNLPITFHDIMHIKKTELKDLRKKNVIKLYRIIVSHLNIAMPVIDHKTRIERIAHNLEQRYTFALLREEWEATKADSIRLLEEYSSSGKLKGRDPLCYAAAALYMSLLNHGIHINQKDVADAALISEVALRFAYNHLRKLR
ncbi:MAG: hypothetical protein QW319_04730 [Candidatus Nitrosocaldus sp.]